MDLDRLRRLQGRERKSDDLCDMDDGFFEEASEYIADLESRVREDQMAMDEARNARRALQGIFDRRLNKILRMVAAGMEVEVDLEPLSSEERKLFGELREALDGYRRSIWDPENNNEEDAEEEGDPEPKVVRVLEDVERFVGTDGRTYRLEVEDVVSLPADSAEVLVSMGAAEEIR